MRPRHRPALAPGGGPLGGIAGHRLAIDDVDGKDVSDVAVEVRTHGIRPRGAAWEKGEFNDEVVPVAVGKGPKAQTVARDEGMRAGTTAETLAKLKPAFSKEPDATVTAGKS